MVCKQIYHNYCFHSRSVVVKMETKKYVNTAFSFFFKQFQHTSHNVGTFATVVTGVLELFERTNTRSGSLKSHLRLSLSDGRAYEMVMTKQAPFQSHIVFIVMCRTSRVQPASLRIRLSLCMVSLALALSMSYVGLSVFRSIFTPLCSCHIYPVTVVSRISAL